MQLWRKKKECKIKSLTLDGRRRWCCVEETRTAAASWQWQRGRWTAASWRWQRQWGGAGAVAERQWAAPGQWAAQYVAVAEGPGRGGGVVPRRRIAGAGLAGARRGWRAAGLRWRSRVEERNVEESRKWGSIHRAPVKTTFKRPLVAVGITSRD